MDAKRKSRDDQLAPWPASSTPSIAVIERSEPREQLEGAERVPFGFSRALSVDRDVTIQPDDSGWTDHAEALAG